MRVGGHAAQERIIRRWFSCGAMVLMAATAAHASDVPVVARRVTNGLLSTPRPAAETVTGRSLGPFVRGTVGIEFGLGFLDEAWDLNGSREALVDGSMSVWWAFLSRTALVVDFHAARVFQQPSRNAFVIGVTPGVRFQIVG